MNKTLKISVIVVTVAVILLLIFTSGKEVSINEKRNSINNESITTNLNDKFILTEKGSLYIEKNEEYFSLNKQIGDQKVKGMYFSEDDYYPYIQMEDDKVYKVGSIYSEDYVSLDEVAMPDTDDNIKTITSGEKITYILTEAGNVYESIKNTTHQIEGLKNIKEIIVSKYIVFAIDETDNLFYWATTENETINKDLTPVIINAKEYMGDSKFVDVRFVRDGNSTGDYPARAFVLTENEVYEVNITRDDNKPSCYTETETEIIANPLTTTFFKYSPDKKVKVQTTTYYNGLTDQKSKLSGDVSMMGEFSDIIIQIHDDGVIIFDSTKIKYGEVVKFNGSIPIGSTVEYVFTLE